MTSRLRSWNDHKAVVRERSVIVTGASGGIGSAVVRAFGGCRIIAMDRSEDVLADLLSGLPADQQELCTPVAVDFSDPESIKAALPVVRKSAKDVGVLVNVAGYTEDATFQMLSLDSIQRQMQVNFLAAVALAQFASRLMVRTGQGGAIVNVGSITGIDGNRGQLAYGASKAALMNATRTMALELGSAGVRVNAVAPGVIDTPMTRSLDAEALEALSNRPVLGRLGLPEEVANVVMWLASPAASYVTGQTLRVDGCI